MHSYAGAKRLMRAEMRRRRRVDSPSGTSLAWDAAPGDMVPPEPWPLSWKRPEPVKAPVFALPTEGN